MSRVGLVIGSMGCAFALLVVAFFARTLYSRLQLPDLPTAPRSPVVPLPSAPPFPPHPNLSRAEQARLDSAELSFIGSVLRSEFHQALSSGGVLAIQSPLSIRQISWFVGDPRTPLLFGLQRNDSALSEAVHDFSDRNGTETDIRRLGTIPIRHRIVSEATVNRILRATRHKTDSWAICLSRPGFDRNLTVGIIYLGVTTPGFHYGHIHVFRKRDGKWINTNQTLGPGYVF